MLRLRLAYTLLTLALCLYGPAQAQDDFFSNIEVDIAEEVAAGEWSLFGWVTEKVGYGRETPPAEFSRKDQELNKLETSLFMQLDWRSSETTSFRASGKAYYDAVYRFKESIPFHPDEVNEFRNRVEVRDLYLEHQAENGIYLKAGHQLQAWGYGEYLRVTDLVNIEDQYTIGQQDLQDIRLQVPAIQFGYSFPGVVLDAVVTYRAGRNDIAPAGDEFDPFINLRQAGFQVEWQDPEQETEVFLRASGQHGRGDYQVVLAEFNDNSLSVERLEGLRSISPRAVLGQNRMQAVAAAANWVDGNWLYFAEAGLHRDKTVRPSDQALLGFIDGWEEKDQVLGLLGVEYNGLRNLVLTFELDNVHTRRHNSLMADSRNEFSYGGRLYWTTLNERIELLAVWNQFGDNSARVARVSVDYDWSDALNFGLLWVDYSAKEPSLFHPYRHNDIVQLQIRYNFQI